MNMISASRFSDLTTKPRAPPTPSAYPGRNENMTTPALTPKPSSTSSSFEDPIEKAIVSLRGQYQSLQKRLERQVTELKQELNVERQNNVTQYALIEQLRKEQHLLKTLNKREENSWRDNYTALAQENTSLRQQIQRAERKAKKSHESLQAIQNGQYLAIADYESQASNALQETARITSMYEKLRHDHHELDIEHQQLNDALEELKRRNESIQEDTNLAKQQLENKEKELQKCQNELRRTQQQNDEDVSIIQHLREQLAQSKDQIASINYQYTTQTDELQHRTHELNQTQAHLDQTKHELFEVNATMSDIQRELNSKTSYIEEIEEQLQDASRTIHEQQFEIETLKSTNVSNEKELLQQQEYAYEAELEMNQCKDEIRGLKISLETYEDRNNILSTNLDELRSDHSSAVAKIQKIEKEYIELETQHSKAMQLIQSFNVSQVMQQNYEFAKAVESAMQPSQITSSM